MRGIRGIIVSLAGLTDFLNYEAVERSLAGQMLYLYSFISLFHRVDDTWNEPETRDEYLVCPLCKDTDINGIRCEMFFFFTLLKSVTKWHRTAIYHYLEM